MNRNLRTFLVVAICSFILFLISPQKSFSQEMYSEEVSPSPTPQQATSSAIIRYELAFPGMLPDHPLYKLKVFRDKVTAAMISDPTKKMEYYLKQTDKGILASAILVDKKKYDLAAETALKAEHNFTILGHEIVFREKYIDDAHLELLETAALKHQEVLLYLAERVPEDKKKTFLLVADFSKRNLQSIKEAIEEQGKPSSNDKDQNLNQ